MSKQVNIIGGGIIGLTTAAALIERGHRVTLIEARANIGDGTSHANNALLTTSFATPLSAPGTPRQFLQWLRADPAISPSRVDWRILPRNSKWGIDFLRACRATPYRNTTRTTIDMARHSLDLLHDFSERYNLDYDQRGGGCLKIFRDPQQLAAFASQQRLLDELGVTSEWLDRDALLAQEPALAHSEEQWLGGWYFPEDRIGDCHAFIHALHRALTERGLRTVTDEPVTALLGNHQCVHGVRSENNDYPADATILCTAFVPDFARRDIAFKVCPVKGYSFTYDASALPSEALPTAAVFDDVDHIGVVRIGSRLRVAGRADLVGHDLTLDPASQQQIRNGLHRLFPRLTDLPELENWCGLRPMVARGLPFIGASKRSGLYANLGHGHLGWTLACASAATLATLIS